MVGIRGLFIRKATKTTLVSLIKVILLGGKKQIFNNIPLGESLIAIQFVLLLFVISSLKCCGALCFHLFLNK